MFDINEPFEAVFEIELSKILLLVIFKIYT